MKWTGILLAVLALALTGCSSAKSSSGRPDGSGPVTITVPGDAPTISAAAAAAHAGDTILVSPGTYDETVNITAKNVTLRGTDRNKVIIDGQVLRANGVVVTASGVAIQNLTVRNNTLNGVLVTGMSDGSGGIAKGSNGYTQLDPSKFPPIDGFRVQYVTASNNGLYGIYAFDTKNGLIEHNYASGGADSGIYVGQCKPCNVLVRGNVAERNAVGYEGTNASQQMYIVGNRFVGNRVGLTTDSDYQEAYIPQTEATVVGNLIANNNQPDSPAQADGGFGIGAGIAAGTHNVFQRNRISNNLTFGLGISSFQDLSPIGNQITDNVFGGNGVDAAYGPSTRAPGKGNCFAGNAMDYTIPLDLAKVLSCPGTNSVTQGETLPVPRAPAGIAFSKVPFGPDQPNITDVNVRLPTTIDDNSYPVPDASLLASQGSISA
jgi:hypothetical protein